MQIPDKALGVTETERVIGLGIPVCFMGYVTMQRGGRRGVDELVSPQIFRSQPIKSHSCWTSTSWLDAIFMCTNCHDSSVPPQSYPCARAPGVWLGAKLMCTNCREADVLKSGCFEISMEFVDMNFQCRCFERCPDSSWCLKLAQTTR